MKVQKQLLIQPAFKAIEECAIQIFSSHDDSLCLAGLEWEEPSTLTNFILIVALLHLSVAW